MKLQDIMRMSRVDYEGGVVTASLLYDACYVN